MTHSAHFADPIKRAVVQQSVDEGSVQRLTDDKSNGTARRKSASGKNSAVSSAADSEHKALHTTNDDDEALRVGGDGDTEQKGAEVVDEVPERRIVRRWPSSADLGMISNGL
ncbi:unnamed protein product [Sphacelaria rigidula]